MPEFKQHRRGFIGTAVTGILGMFPAASAMAQGTPSPHDAWLKDLNGKHRQFFDVGRIDEGTPLRRVHNFLATYATSYGVAESDVNAVFGAHGAAIGFLVGDDGWARFRLGQMYGVSDPATKQPATRNVFARSDALPAGLSPDASVTRLRERGVRLLVCNNTLTALAARLTAGGHGGTVHEALIASLLPGVIIVPAMLIAGNRAQEAGLTYALLG